MNPSAAEVQKTYETRIEAFAEQQRQLERHDRQLSPLRLLLFGGMVLFLVLGFLFMQNAWFWAAGAAFLIFTGVITYQDSVRRKLDRASQLRKINEQCVARVRRDWSALPEVHAKVPPQYAALAADLDLFGHASVFHLMCLAGTPQGVEVLSDWLLHPADPDEIRLRQAAAEALADEVELREQLVVHGRLLSGRGEAARRFVEWAESERWLARRPWLTWTCRILPAVGLITTVLTVLSIVDPWVGVGVIGTVLLLNTVITVFLVGFVHDIFSRVSTRNGEVARYREMFGLLYGLNVSSSKIEAIQKDVTARGGGVRLRLMQLDRLMLLANLKHSPMFFIPVYLPLQLLFLFDFHLLPWVESWQEQYGQHARHWFRALGEFEAVCSLALLRHDNPDWVFAEVDVAAENYEATQLAHPLMAAESRVANDVSFGPPGTGLLVTGSNMSGKSTLLRSIGVNAVLAQAGAPSCATRLRIMPLLPATSMRIQDSLEDGVSFYMAELKRLKQIVDIAIEYEARPERTLLFLLDEILQGTNSRERHIAVVRVLSHLLEHKAIGAVSTHDLELATTEPLDTRCQTVHFRETLHHDEGKKSMSFDYQLRPGVATTTNALKLLEIVGLGE